MELLFAVCGIFFAVLLVLSALFRRTVGFLNLLFAFAATLLLLTSLISGHLNGEPSDLIYTVVLVTAAALLVLGLLMTLFKRVNGVLLAGSAVLLIAARFFVPAAADYFNVAVEEAPIQPFLTITPLIRNTPDATTTTPTNEIVVNETQTTLVTMPSVTASQTPAARPTRQTPTIRPSRTRYASPTPSETPTLPSPCLVVALYNVNMRAEPSLQAELVATIPFETAVSAYGRNEDRTWWFVEYEGSAGWVSDEFVSTTPSCQQLPVQ